MKANSFAIDRSITTPIEVDLDCNLRPFGSSYDIGCYEFTNLNLIPTAKVFIEPNKTTVAPG
ncbi:MAG: hypothetical protein NZ894_05735, partial [Archaeoglobaceae archaeon]|nr:hypothetical protein [Archaeoglobaceae archaeon]